MYYRRAKKGKERQKQIEIKTIEINLLFLCLYLSLHFILPQQIPSINKGMWIIVLFSLPIHVKQ